MVGPFLREATILIFFCQIFVSGEDLLEIYRPNPSLPQELNDWLTKVQEHKGDFRLIRESVGEQPKKLFHFNEDYEDEEPNNKEDFDNLYEKDENKNQRSENTDDRPQNDIYPYVFQSLKTNVPSFDANPINNKRLNSKKIKNPIRFRRSSNDTPFFENKNSINVETAGKVGELKRADNKYPDSFSRNQDKISDSNNEKSNINEEEESVVPKEAKKREIQIDIKNDGKLVKQIREDSKNPKSIVLNIQPPEVPLDSLINNKLLEPNINNLNSYKGFRVNQQELTDKIKNTPDVNMRSESNQFKSKEMLNNYNNLFTVNEHLNTDNSLAHESTTSDHMIHHMALPEVNSLRGFTYPSVPQSHNYDVPAAMNNINNNKKPFPIQNNYNNNNMKDMSSFWTTNEKNQMQKGLDRARINKNYLAQSIKPLPSNKAGAKVKESANGFEPAQRIELESESDANSCTQGISNIDYKNGVSNFRMDNVSGVNSMNNMNNFNNLNNIKDMNINDGSNDNSLNGIKFVPNGTNSFVGDSGMNGVNPLNGFNYDPSLNHQGNNRLADENNFNSSQDTSKIQSKRQLEVLQGNLQLLNNLNPNKYMVNLANLSDDNNIDIDKARWPGAKRNDEINPASLFERVYPIERDSATVGLGEELPSNAVIGENIESVNLDESPKSADEINLDNSLNNNEELPNVGYDDTLKGKEPGVSDNELPSDTNVDSSNTGTGPVGVVEDEFLDNTNLQSQDVPSGVLPSAKDLPQLPEHNSNKHVKTIVRKINKNIKNYNRVTEIETITEIDYPDVSGNQAEGENINEMEKEGEEESSSEEDLNGEEHLNEEEHMHEKEPNEEIDHHEKDHAHGNEKETLMEIDIDSCDDPENHHPHEVNHNSQLNKGHHEEDKENEDGHVNEKDMSSCDEPDIGIEEAHDHDKNIHNSKLNEDHHETEIERDKGTLIIDVENHHEPHQINGKVHHLLRDIHNPIIYENRPKHEANVVHRSNNFRGRSNSQHVHHMRNLYPKKLFFFNNKPYGFRKKKYYGNSKPRLVLNYGNDFPPPAELIIKKRETGNHPRKRYRKRHQKNNPLSFLDDFNSQQYESVLRKEEGDASVDTSNKSNDLIPAFIGRQLKAVDYAYDAYLHRPGGEDFDEEVSTELQEVASNENLHPDTVHVSTAHLNISPKKNFLGGLLHKNSVEGDYGEEEDSVTEARNKNGNNIIKKTENEFANPRTTTEGEDYEDYDNYNSVSSIDSEKLKLRQLPQVHKSSRKKSPLKKVQKRPADIKEHDIKSFAHHRHKYKPRAKPNKHPLSIFETRNENNLYNDAISIDEPQSPLQLSNIDKFVNRKLVDVKSDFQHWPSFVIDDNKNEEKLRKRSLVMKKKYPRAFNFPLASKDFFVKPQKKAGSANVKREKPNSMLDEGNINNESTKFPGDDGGQTLVSTEKGKETATSLHEAASEVDFCDKPSSLSNACEDKESFNKTFVQMTTILAIIPEPESASDTQECENNVIDFQTNSSNPESVDDTQKINTTQEKLDDILNGQLPLHLVQNVMDHLMKNFKLKNRFNKGLKQVPHDKNFLQSLNDTNLETQKLVQSMTNIMNKLQFTATCQSLPHKLRRYLKSITRGHKTGALEKTKEMEEVELDDGQNQDNFIFESSPQGDNFEGKVKILQDLLERFNKLPDKCKARAMPVKEYIENHLGMLNNMLSTMNNGPQKNAKPKKSIDSLSNGKFKSEDELIEEQLESLGLGKQHKFKPKFDLDQMVENKLGKASNSEIKATDRSRNVKVNKRDLNTVSRSKKYDKLVDAVRRLRLRREGEKRLGEMYGRARMDSNDYDGVHLNWRSEDGEDMSKANFESPLVYSL